MKKTVNIPEDVHKALKLYSIKQDEQIADVLTRVLVSFLLKTGDLPSREI